MTDEHDHESHGGGHEGRDDGHGHDDHSHSHGHGHDHSHSHDDDHDHSHSRDHDHHHHDVETVGFAVLTVSSSRTLAEDPSGDAIEALVRDDDGADLVARELVGDSAEAIGDTLDGFLGEAEVDAVVTTGGTGITPDDVTVEVVSERLDKELPGFGEFFRRRSEAEVGTRALGTRAAAGVADGTLVFALPGSENAARLGVEELVLPEVGHLVGLAGR